MGLYRKGSPMDQRLTYTFLVAIAIEILFPLFLGLWLRRRFRVPWKLFAYGALVYVAVQLPRYVGIQVLQSYLRDTLQAGTIYMVAWIAFAALTAGLFEEGGRYLGYRFLWGKEEKTWPGALMYGAGHGGVESIVLVGLVSIWSLLQFIALQQIDMSALSPEELATVEEAIQIFAAVPWWAPLMAALERLLAITIQISLAVLVLQVFRRGRFYWWWLAVGYHTVVDLLVVLAPYLLAQYLPPEATTFPTESITLLFALVTESITLLFALLGIGIILRLRPAPAEPLAASPPAAPPP